MMSDEFSNHVPEKFPNTTSKENPETEGPVEKPRIVPRNAPGSFWMGDRGTMKNGLSSRVDQLYSDLRSSLTIRSALEYDRRKANQLLEEVTRVEQEIEKIIEMLRVMEDYMRERTR